jgi:hypothetical protein
MENDEPTSFIPLSLPTGRVLKRLTEHREREHREGSESNCEKQAEKAASSHAGHEIVNELKHHTPPHLNSLVPLSG